jgi:predicted AlkP superfamily phosphohydrolase/phosphomutase
MMATAASGRSVVLGVDSVDLLLMQRWCAQGLLPFFDSMLESGSLARLSTVSRVLQGAVWPSLLSGRSPGQHGIYFLTQLTNRTYNLDPVQADHSNLDPYYLHLDANGVRCAIVDVPDDMPRKRFKGFQIVDWLTEFKYWRFAMQAGAGKRGARLEMFCKTGGYGPTTQTLDGHRVLRHRLERGIALKGALTQELLARTDLDHLFVVFGESHKAGHLLWQYMDPAHPDHVVAEPYLRDALLGIYQALDRQLAELAASLRPDDNLLIFSDHGMQPNYRGDHFIVPMLQRLGLCEPEQVPVLESLSRTTARPNGAAGPATSSTAAGRLGRAKSLIKRLAPEFATTFLRHRFGVPSRIDWNRTRVFQLPTDRNSYLRVNVRGREPNGIVARGKEYDDVLRLLEAELRALVNVETGLPAVEEVFKIHELFPGPRVDDLPDLAVLWNAGAPINSVQSPSLGRMDIRANEDRPGNHRAEGFVLARGPAIRPNVAKLHADVLQVPATFLALHGVAIPSHFEMGPMYELLADEFKQSEGRAPAGFTPPGQAHLPARPVPAHQATPDPSA